MAVYGREIVGLTIKMRSLEEKDDEKTYKMRTDSEKAKYLHSAPSSIEEQRNYIREQRKKYGDYYFLIEDLQGNCIGVKGFYDLDAQKRRIASGRFISYGSQVQNIETMCLGFDFVFNELGLDTIVMAAVETNGSMRSLQARFGAKETHRVYEEYFGMYQIYSLLAKKDYCIVRPKIEELIKRFAYR